MTYNKLRLNSSKTEFLVVVSPSHRRLIDITKPLLRIGNSVVSPSSSVRNLGVILDAQMTMRQRVTSIVRSANAHPRSLGRLIRRYLNATTPAAAAGTLILSRLDYANTLLSGLFNKLTNRLQVVQNNAARLVTRTSPRSHMYTCPSGVIFGCLFHVVLFTKLCVWLNRACRQS